MDGIIIGVSVLAAWYAVIYGIKGIIAVRRRRTLKLYCKEGECVVNDNQSQVVDLCSWCRHTYDRDSGVPIQKLSDEEFAAFRLDGEPTHGICAPCRKAAMAEGMAARRRSDV